MKFVIQRVKSASVKVNDEIVGSIEKGILVLIGLTHNDNYSDIEFAANKLLNIRLWDDSKGTRWKESVKSLNLDVLIVSQFTLYAFLKGNKPDFHNAMDPEPALKMYNTFVEVLKKNYKGNIQCGKFGEMMEVSLVNDGPVTINWEYPEVKESTQNLEQNTKIKNKISNKGVINSAINKERKTNEKEAVEETIIKDDTNDINNNLINLEVDKKI